jgi:glycosyltransferase involved in cell wall biosynthesis
MRILAITNLYPNPFQPYRATFNREQIKALSKEHLVRVLAPIAWTDELAALRGGSPPLPPGRRMKWDNVLVEYPRSWFTPRLLRAHYGRFLVWSLRGWFCRALNEFRPDLVFGTWAYPDGWAAVKLARRAGLPVVLKVHGSDILELGKYPARRQGTIEALCGADRVVTVSRDLAQNAIALGAPPEHVHLIYNGVDDSVFFPGDRGEARVRLGLDPVRPVLLYVGNLLPVKGPDVLIDAAAALTVSVDFHLHVIGQGPLRRSLEARAVSRGLNDRVCFHGPVAHQDLPDWFRASNFLVLPSRSEGVPNVLLEAAACGTPIVASCVGGVPEVAHLGPSRLVPPDDPGALAGAIADLLRHPPAPLVRPRGARSHAATASELVSVFQSALGLDDEGSRRTLFQPATTPDTGSCGASLS